MPKMTQPPESPWDEWVQRITGGATQAEIGKRLGVSRATVSRWSRRADSNSVIALARAYNADPLAGLLAAGVLKDVELTKESQARVLKRVSTLDLAFEMCSRVHEKGIAPYGKGSVA